MPEQTPLTKPEIIAFPGDNAELPAKTLERQIYADPERFQKAMNLGALVLSDVVTEPDKEKKIEPDSDEIKGAKELVRDGLRAILDDEKLRRSIWFDDNTELAMEKDEKYNQLRRVTPRTEKALKEMRFRQFAIFVDRVVEYKSRETSLKKNLRRTG